MPLAYAPAPPRTDVLLPNTVVSPTVPVGQFSPGVAVALVTEGGANVYRPCGCKRVDYADHFLGFIDSAVSASGAVSITVLRGAIVTPVRENDLPLVVGAAVYLSVTAGQVTAICPASANCRILRLGMALSPTTFVFNTDMQMEIP